MGALSWVCAGGGEDGGKRRAGALPPGHSLLCPQVMLLRGTVGQVRSGLLVFQI